MQLGGLICHLLLVPIFVLACVPPITATVLLALTERYDVELAQAALCILCCYKSSPGDALGVASTAAAAAITAALAIGGADSHAVVGSAIWMIMTGINWGHSFAYSPAWTRFIFRMNMASYYTRAELRSQGGTKALDSMPTSRAIYLFHPHGIVTCGFSSNGVWSREFNERTTPKPLPPNWEAREWPGTIFLIAQSLRVPSHLFKLLCDVSGRLESASRDNMKRLLAAGRNVAIIPGGFEEATLFEHGVHRVAMSKRKGLIKYALQYGYSLVPIYSFGENKSFYTLAPQYSMRFRLWLNSFQFPAVVFWGEPLLPILPRRDAHCLTYVGPPLQLPKIEEPSPAQVDEWHAAYMAALQKLFDASKAEAEEPKAVLEVW